MKQTDYGSWYEKRQRYLDRYYSWLDENEMLCEDEEIAIDMAALSAAQDDMQEWRKKG